MPLVKHFPETPVKLKVDSMMSEAKLMGSCILESLTWTLYLEKSIKRKAEAEKAKRSIPR